MEGKVEADVDAATNAGGAPLSKAQKKKLKDKAKKEAELAAKQAADGGAATSTTEAPAAQTGGAKGKKGGKKPNAAAAAALAKTEALRKEREEEERIQKEEEEKFRVKEELRIKELEDAKKLKDGGKQKKKDRIQELKDSGQYKSKKQLAADKVLAEKRAKLIADGVIKIDDEQEEGDKPKSHAIRNKKKDKRNQKPEEKVEEEKQDKNIEQDQEKDVQIDSSSKTTKTTQPDKKQQKEESSEAEEDWENADIDTLVDQFKGKDGTSPTKKNDEEDNEDILRQQIQDEKDKQNKTKGKKAEGKQKASDKKTEDEGGDIFSVETTDKEKAERIKKRKDELLARQKKRKAELQKKKGGLQMRCPIVCILGHVDTGKTKILDKLRKTNVQDGEAGGITQQIGATYFPPDYIDGHVQKMQGKIELELKLPGFLVIDTPGHESFTNLRSRGSSLCDVAILVVDIMHSLEKQTLESIELLRQKKCPFIIALNKIDRLTQWKTQEFNNSRDALAMQEAITMNHFDKMVSETVLGFAEQEFNAILYWDNTNPDEYVSLVPTSAITGEGLPDLMSYLTHTCQTRIPNQLYMKEEFECSVLEVKVIEGFGATIDVVLVNGVLKVQDTIVLQGLNGPIVTQIRALLTPQPMKEMRVKNEYIHHRSIQGAMGIKISAPGLELAIAGTELYVGNNKQQIDDAIEEMKNNMHDILDKYVDKTQDGVCVQASTLGSLEALLEFLLTSKIPVANISIGPVHKKDVLKATKVLAIEDQTKVKKEFATILAFDVRVTKEAQEHADSEGIKIFTAQIIYHLFDEFTEYYKICQEERKNAGGGAAIWPCTLEIIPDFVFNRQSPIIMGVNVTAGTLRVGTPLAVPERENIKIGVVTSIELNKKKIQSATAKDGPIAIRVEGENATFGRQFDEKNQVCSLITRRSIDALKGWFKGQMNTEDVKLIVLLKKAYKIE